MISFRSAATTSHKIVNGAGAKARFLTDVAHAKDATGLCLVAHIQFTPVRVGKRWDEAYFLGLGFEFTLCFQGEGVAGG
jgi:hypothetical protein